MFNRVTLVGTIFNIINALEAPVRSERYVDVVITTKNLIIPHDAPQELQTWYHRVILPHDYATRDSGSGLLWRNLVRQQTVLVEGILNYKNGEAFILCEKMLVLCPATREQIMGMGE